MKQYEYVRQNEYEPVRKKYEQLFHRVQQELRTDIDFAFVLVGSASRDMITREIHGNEGYDFDYDFVVDFEIDYSPKELKEKLMNALDKFGKQYGIKPSEDSKRVITIKLVDHQKSSIIHSCDIAIVRKYRDEDDNICCQFVSAVKKKGRIRSIWNNRSNGYLGLEGKEKRIRQEEKWEELEEVYLEKKCHFSDEKPSRSLYVEAVNEVFSRLSSDSDETIENYNNGFSGAVLVTNKVKHDNWSTPTLGFWQN